MAIVSEGGSAGAVSPFPRPLCEGKQKERFALNVLVVGSGRLGRYLANMLDEEGHDVAIVDENADNFRHLNKDFSGITVEGVPMDMEVLKTAGIESCDGVAVATPDDNLNITVSQIAREFFGVRNVVARISDPAREQVFKKLGLKSICHTKWAGEAMLNALVRPWDDRHLTIETSTIGFRSYLVEKRDWGDTPEDLARRSREVPFVVIHSDGSTEFCCSRKIPLAEGDKVIFSRIED